jgi:RHS repeat-associated protein
VAVELVAKERDDSSGLCHYGARYLAPWLTRWINPDATGAVDGLNLYVYVDNNPLKYIDPTGHVKVIPASFLKFELKTNSPLEKYIVFLKSSPDGQEKACPSGDDFRNTMYF